MGTGPYLATEKDTETGMTFVKNPNYWGRDDSGRQLPYMDKMNRPVIAEKATAASADAGGEPGHVRGTGRSSSRSRPRGIKNQLGGQGGRSPGEPRRVAQHHL